MSPPMESPSQPALRNPPKDPIDVIAEAEQQWLFTENELLHSPSIVDGMPASQEREVRSKGVNFILQVGIMLKLPQMTLSTAAVFFNRYLMRRSLVEMNNGHKALHHYQVAAISLYLATKVEEHCRKIKELVIACCRVAQKNPNLIVDDQTKDYWRWRDSILLHEDVLLEMLCFDLYIDSPYKILWDLLNHYGVENNREVRTSAWAFLNDSNLTQLCLLFPSRTIACAAVYVGAKHGGVAFPDEHGKAWWAVQRVRLRDIRRACNYMAGWYAGSHLKPGMGEGVFMGLRTPEDGDEETAKTRLREPPDAHTPFSPGGSTSSAANMERSESQQSLKRSRDEFEDGGERKDIRNEELARVEKGEEDNREANGQPRKPSRKPPAAQTMPNGAPRAAWAAVRGEPAAKKAKVEEGEAASSNIPVRGPQKAAHTEDPADGSEEGELEE